MIGYKSSQNNFEAEQIDKMRSTNMKTESCIKAARCQRARRQIGLFDINRVKGNKLAVEISEEERQTLINTSKFHPVNRLIPQAWQQARHLCYIITL